MHSGPSPAAVVSVQAVCTSLIICCVVAVIGVVGGGMMMVLHFLLSLQAALLQPINFFIIALLLFSIF
jgi:hypothetical protein